MVELNHTLLADLVLSGYTYMIYVGKENYAVLHPLKGPAPEVLLEAMGVWQLPILEREFQTMADGEELIDFKFYIDESLFNEN